MSNLEEQKFLELYSDSEYEKPSVTVDAVVLRLFDEVSTNYRKLPEKKLQVFLTKRNYSPYINTYSIVGTFINLDYELAESMKKCVHKKVGLENYYYEQLFTFGEKSRDPRTRVLSVSYMLLTNSNAKIENGEWFDIDIKENIISKEQTQNGYYIKKQISITLSNSDTKLENTLTLCLSKHNLDECKEFNIDTTTLAFDHIKMIYFALERLKNKLEYTDIIFSLLPKEFTLTELKNSYEVILGEKLLDANFRRKTAKYVSPTNQYVTGKGHRSSRLYVHKPLSFEK